MKRRTLLAGVGVTFGVSAAGCLEDGLTDDSQSPANGEDDSSDTEDDVEESDDPETEDDGDNPDEPDQEDDDDEQDEYDGDEEGADPEEDTDDADGEQDEADDTADPDQEDEGEPDDEETDPDDDEDVDDTGEPDDTDQEDGDEPDDEDADDDTDSDEPDDDTDESDDPDQDEDEDIDDPNEDDEPPADDLEATIEIGTDLEGMLEVVDHEFVWESGQGSHLCNIHVELRNATSDTDIWFEGFGSVTNDAGTDLGGDINRFTLGPQETTTHVFSMDGCADATGYRLEFEAFDR